MMLLSVVLPNPGVERFATILGSLNEHFQVLHHLLLSAEVAESQRTEGVLKVLLALTRLLLAYIEIFFHYAFYCYYKLSLVIYGVLAIRAFA